ncbi:hypothetical protein GL297_01445 [Komagataeibacter sp. FXV2]|nr:hypothetical protein [Komagataeibacter sp. FXV2]
MLGKDGGDQWRVAVVTKQSECYSLERHTWDMTGLGSFFKGNSFLPKKKPSLNTEGDTPEGMPPT